MNKTIENFARQKIKEEIVFCTPEEQLFFKRMYSHKDLDKDIMQVIDDMPADKLNWALTQIQNTLKKL